MEKQKETVSDSKVRPRRSVLEATLWAVKMSVVCNGLLILILMILGVNPEVGRRVNFPPNWLLPGFSLWNAVFGGPWHNSFVWFFSSLALNLIIYFGLALIVTGLFIAWKRSLHSSGDNSHMLTR